VSDVLLLASVTASPPVGAVVLKVTIHVAAALEFRFAGLHVRDEIVGTVAIRSVTPETVRACNKITFPISNVLT
jgi:hypothetical protein